MASLNPEVDKKNQNLTRFLCQELLYEFISGNLDLEKQRAMDNYLTGCRESQQELERLKKAIAFTAQVAEIPVSSELRRALLGFEPVWKRRFRDWTLWWSSRGWKMLPYVVISAVFILGIIVTKPWKPLLQKEVVLAEQKKADSNLSAPPPGAKLETKGISPLEPPPAAAPLSAPLIGVIEAEAPAKAKTFLMRAKIEVSDFATTVPAIREKILALGGSVIGKLELGSELKPLEAFFNFSLPESKREELETFLTTFGPVRFHKEADPRVMPEGEIHTILTVKDGSANEVREETPAP